MNWELLIQLMLNGVIVGTLYGVVAACFVLIYKATQVINFAQGDFLYLGAAVCWSMVVTFQLPFWLAFPLAFVFMAAFGYSVQRVLLRPMIGEPLISVIMITIGLSVVMQKLLTWIYTATPHSYPQIFASNRYRDWTADNRDSLCNEYDYLISDYVGILCVFPLFTLRFSNACYCV